MKKDARFEVIKDIPIGNNKSIPAHTMIYRMHGMYYMDGVLLTQDYQQDFDDLIEYERVNGWKYICPVKINEAFKNDKQE